MPVSSYTSSTADFFRAVETRDNVLLRRLIAARRDVNARGPRGRTPLHVSLLCANADAARLLLDAGADANARDDLRETPFLLCGAEGRAESLAHMLKCGAPDAALLDREGNTALFPACARGHVEVVKLLIGAGVRVNHVNEEGRNALLEMLECGGDDGDHVEIAKELIAAKVNVNLRDREGHTALFLAKKYKFKRISNLLEKAGARE